MRRTIATRSRYAGRLGSWLASAVVLALHACAGSKPATPRDPAAMAGIGGGGGSGGVTLPPIATAGSGGSAGSAGSLSAGTGDPPDPVDAGDVFHNPTDAFCDAAELAAACVGQQCGLSDGCPQQLCGACDEDAPCQRGVCMTPEALCDQSPEMCECLPVMFSLPTFQACSISVTTELDGEAFVEVDGARNRVLAIDRWGEGHVIAWCDGSTNDGLLMAFQALPYLGRKPIPRFASFGNQPLCDPDFGVEHFAQPPVDLGAELPVNYLGHPELLAADWDVILFCGFHTMWDPGWAGLIESYVAVHGKGFFASMDYQGFDATLDDFTKMNEVMLPSGISFDPVSINWADATADIGIACLPDLTPAVL